MTVLTEAVEAAGSDYHLVGPLRLRDHGAYPAFLEECEDARGQYLGHRSTQAPANTVSFHVSDDAGIEVGFISSRIASEHHGDLSVIFVSVEYIYVERDSRNRKLASMLLGPLVDAIELDVIETLLSRPPGVVRILSTSNVVRTEGTKALAALERRLIDIAKRHPTVEVIGKLADYPLGAAQRLEVASRVR